MRTVITQALALLVGTCAIIWAAQVFPFFRAEASLGDLAWRAASGENFSDTQFGAIRNMVEDATAAKLDSSNMSSIAVIRLFLVDRGLRSGTNSPADMAQLETAVSEALAEAPTNGFTWLIADWLKRRKGGAVANDMTMLRMSYRTGPNEGWIAVKRNPVAVSSLPSLPHDLADKALAEFAGLVRGQLYPDAAAVLANAGPSVREQLLGTLVNVDEDDRRQFAWVLASKDIEVTVPGVQQRPSRHF